MKPGTWYSIDSIPSYTCPLCKTGRIEPDLKAALCRQTGESASLNNVDYWEASFHQEILRIDLSCSDSECREVGVLVMRGELWEPNEFQRAPEVCYEPIYINPAPHLFTLENEYPASVRKFSEESFSLFWIDLPSCGNKIRVAVEALLDELGVEKEVKDKNGIAKLTAKGWPKPMTLDARLQLYGKLGAQQQAYSGMLEAIRVLGNEASHHGDIPVYQKQVYRAIMVFGDVLAHLFKGTPIDPRAMHDIEHINFWYHPNAQQEFPKKPAG